MVSEVSNDAIAGGNYAIGGGKIYGLHVFNGAVVAANHDFFGPGAVLFCRLHQRR